MSAHAADTMQNLFYTNVLAATFSRAEFLFPQSCCANSAVVTSTTRYPSKKLTC